MFRRILFVVTVVVVLLTVVQAYNGATIEDGALIEWDRCGDGTDYYSRHESECDTIRFIIPCIVGPVWLILLVLWLFVWLQKKTSS